AAAVTYDSTRSFFGEKAVVSGNPVRPEFFSAGPSREASADGSAVVRVLVFGGSQGAHAVNVAMVEAAAELAAHRSHLRLTHQTGSALAKRILSLAGDEAARRRMAAAARALARPDAAKVIVDRALELIGRAG